MFERLGSDPLKDEPADALGIELGLLAKSSGCFFVSEAHLFFTALSVLQRGVLSHQVLDAGFSCV